MGPADAPSRYELIERHAAGGEGEVWRAAEHHSGVSFHYAVKIIHAEPQGDPEKWLDGLRLQAAILTQLEHPALVKVREVFVGSGVEGDTPSLYLVMKWIEATSLQDALDSGQISGLTVLSALEGIADAIDYLHSGRDTGQAVIHRDIKPANILATNDGRVYLVDFGLVRFAGAVTRSRVSGTIGFMAPESLRKGEYSPASDRYALGATTYYALTGESPLPGDVEGMGQQLATTLGPGNDRIIGGILAMLSIDPAKRPASAAAWVRALREPPAETTIGAPLSPPAETITKPLTPTTPLPTPPPPPPSLPTSGARTFDGPGAAFPGPSLSAAAAGLPHGGPPPPPKRKKSKGKVIGWTIGVSALVLVLVCCGANIVSFLNGLPDSTTDGGRVKDSPAPKISINRGDPPPGVSVLKPVLLASGEARIAAGWESIYDSSEAVGYLRGGLTNLEICDGVPVTGAAIGSELHNGYYGDDGYIASSVAGFYGDAGKRYMSDARNAAVRCGLNEFVVPKLGEESFGVYSRSPASGEPEVLIFVRKGKIITQVVTNLDEQNDQPAAIEMATAMAKRIPAT